MKKLLFLIFAFVCAAHSNAQMTVKYGVNDLRMGNITCIHPVVTYDTTVVSDTIINIGTVSNWNQWYLLAEPKNGYIFSHWICLRYRNGVISTDTVYSEVNFIEDCHDNTDSVIATAYFKDIASLLENGEKTSWLVAYPNPTNSTVHLNCIVEEYYLYDEFGNAIVSGANANLIDLSEYRSGIYFLRTEYGIIKIIKK